MDEMNHWQPVDDRCDPALLAVYRTQSPSAKLAMLDTLWRSTAALVRCGVADQHPEWSDVEVFAETARHMSNGSRATTRA